MLFSGNKLSLKYSSSENGRKYEVTMTGVDSHYRESYGTRLNEHRITPTFIIEFNQILDIVEKENINEACVLCLTGEGNFFSNGLDLEYLKLPNVNIVDFISHVESLFARILSFSIPTVAILNGHTVAAGLMLALCCDVRFIHTSTNVDRYSSFIPAVDLGIHYTAGMSALMESKMKHIPSRAEILLLGKRLKLRDLVRLSIAEHYSGSIPGFCYKLPTSSLHKLKTTLYEGVLSQFNKRDDMGFKSRAYVESTIIPLTVYFAPTPNAWKVTMFLEEIKLPYTLEYVDILNGENKTKQFADKFPAQRIPGIFDTNTGQYVWESGAILLYISNTYGSFCRNIDTSLSQIPWMFWQSAHLGPTLGQLNHFKNYAPHIQTNYDDRYTLDRFISESRRLAGILENQLSSHSFIAGEKIGLSDFMSFPWLLCCRKIGLDLSVFPRIELYIESIKKRDCYVKGLTDLNVVTTIPNVINSELFRSNL